MKLINLSIREALHRRVNFALGVLSVLIATAVLSGALRLLDAHDLRTEEILAGMQAELETQIGRLQDDTVRYMQGLGFNIVILPAGQNLSDWYAEDYAAQTMPADNAALLAAGGLTTLEDIEPVLRRKIRWPETQWTVLIAGRGGQDAPPAGQADIGDEIARGLNLRAGSSFKLMEQPFTVRNVWKQEAGAADITLTLALEDAQRLLGMDGRISEIRAVQRRAAWQDIARIRDEVARILPGTQVIEKGSEVLAKVTAIRQVEEKGAAQIQNEQRSRGQLKQSLQRILGLLLPFILLTCAAWIWLLTADNTARRTVEIGTLRSLGFSSGSVAAVFLFRALLTGLAGGAAGLLLSAALAHGMSLKLAGLLLPMAVLLSLAGSLPPVWRAVRRDPADILRGDI